MQYSPLVSVVVFSSVLSFGATAAQTEGQARPAVTSTPHFSTKADLKVAMRKLWTDHVVWSRDYLIAAVDDKPAAEAAAAARLMKNQEDIGNVFATYYGAPAGQQLTWLLKEHISIALVLITAATTGDETTQKEAAGRWQQNAAAIATFLNMENPHWPKDALASAIKKHLSRTATEVAARVANDYNGDVKAFDDVSDHILMMADALTDGIVKQFPDQFNAP